MEASFRDISLFAKSHSARRRMVAAIKTVKMKKLGDSFVDAAAKQIQAANKQLAASHDGSAWGALDPQLEKLKSKGKPSE